MSSLVLPSSALVVPCMASQSHAPFATTATDTAYNLVLGGGSEIPSRFGETQAYSFEAVFKLWQTEIGDLIERAEHNCAFNSVFT